MATCPVCGTQLRWVPEYNAWGCDRCQQMIAPAAPVPGPGPAPPRSKSRAWIFILLGVGVVAAIGVVIAVVATRSSYRLDCDKHIDKRVALALEGRTGQDRDTMEHRLRLLYLDECGEGRVSKSQADCVQAATTDDAADDCLGLGLGSGEPVAGAGGAAQAIEPVAARAARAVDAYFGLMKEFDVAFGKDGGDCDNRVPRVDAALAAAGPRRDALVTLLSDPAVARAAVVGITHPSEANDDIRYHFNGLFVDGLSQSCSLQGNWRTFIEPADRLLGAAYEAMGGNVPAPPTPDAGPEADQEGMPPNSGIAECDALPALRARAEACAALGASTRQAIIEVIYNNLWGFRTGAPKNPDYARYVRSKCAGAGAFARDYLQQAGCR